MNPPFHPPSVCPSANLSPFHLPHIETRQWGPHPSSVCFTTFLPCLGHSFLHWGTHFYILYIFPKFIYWLLYKPLYSQPFTVNYSCRHRWRPSFLFFGHTQPMLPLVGASLLIYPRQHRLYLQSTTQVTYHLSSEFVHLVPPLAQLIPGLVVPLTLDPVTWLRPLFLS